MYDMDVGFAVTFVVLAVVCFLMVSNTPYI